MLKKFGNHVKRKFQKFPLENSGKFPEFRPEISASCHVYVLRQPEKYAILRALILILNLFYAASWSSGHIGVSTFLTTPFLPRFARISNFWYFFNFSLEGTEKVLIFSDEALNILGKIWKSTVELLIFCLSVSVDNSGGTFCVCMWKRTLKWRTFFTTGQLWPPIPCTSMASKLQFLFFS